MTNKSTLSKRISQWIVQKPKQVLSIGVVALVLLTLGIPRLTADFSYRVWFKESNTRLQEFDKFERKFGSDEVLIVGIHSPSGVFDKDTAHLLKDLTKDLWLIPEVIRVDSLANFNWVHGQGDEILVDPFLNDDEEIDEDFLRQRAEVARNHRNIQGYLVSEDLKTSLAYINLKPSLQGQTNYELINKELRKILSKYKNSDQYGDDHEFYTTGSGALNFSFKESSQADMQKLIPLVFLITLIFLTLFFKSLSGVLLPVVVIFTATLATLGFSGWVGIEMNVMTAMVPQFIIAISIAVIVHLLVAFFQFMKKGLGKNEALQMAIEKNLTPTLLTSVSTAIGFLTYATSHLLTIVKFGILAGFGTLAAWAFSFFIVSPLIALLPLKNKHQKNKSSEGLLKPTPLAYKITDLLKKFSLPIVLIYLSVAGASLYMASKTPVSSDPYKYFADDYPISIANNFVEDNVGGAMGIEMVIESGQAEGIKDPEFLEKVDQYQKWVESHEFITKTISIVDILKEMNQTLEGGDPQKYQLADNQQLLSQQLFLYTMNLPQGMDMNNRITIQNDATRLTAMSLDHESSRFMKFIDVLENKAKEMGLNIWVSGKAPLWQSMNGLVVDSFQVSLSLAVVLVGLLMLIGLRSIKMGLISLVPNALPLIIGAGFVYLYGASLDVGTVIVGSICLGIAVDDTIHFLANYQTYRSKGDDAYEAIAKVFTTTVPALITTTVVLVAAFGCFVLASFVPNKQFGVFVAFILSVALITDILLLPVLLLLIDRDKKAS